MLKEIAEDAPIDVKCGEWLRSRLAGLEDFAGQVSLQAADDLGLGHSFGLAAFGVGRGTFAVSEPDDGGHV